MSSVMPIDVCYMRRRMHFACIGLIVACFVWGATAAQSAESDLVLFDIPRQPLDLALTSFARQARVAALFPLELVQGKVANLVRGRYRPNDALAILLRGTGLEGHVDPAGRLSLRSSEPVSGAADIEVGGSADATGRPPSFEEVIVTARRKEESLNLVPLSVSVFLSDDIDQRSIENVEDLNVLLPNVNIRSNGISASQGLFFVRGIPGVARYVDGVVQRDDAGALFNIVGLERIEVLRGPQGTLYGKNAIGGAIQFLTQAPEAGFGGDVSVTMGDFRRRDVIADVNIELSDSLATRFTAARFERDGYVQSLTAPVAYGDVGNDVVRGQLLWRPTTDFKARFILESNAVDQGLQANVLWGVVEDHPQVMAYNDAGLTLTNDTHAFASREQYLTRSQYEGAGDYLDSEAFTADLQWDVTERSTLRLISGARDFAWSNYHDYDATEFAFYEQYDYELHNERSHELQLQHMADRLSWTAGVYYGDSRSRNRKIRWQYEEIEPRPDNRLTGQETTDTAAFAEGTYQIVDRFALTLGLRYSVEEFSQASYSRSEERPARPTMTRDLDAGNLEHIQAAKFESLTPRASLAYSPGEAFMAYLTYSEGFNGGGVNVVPVDGRFLPFGEETLDLLELGFRGTFARRRLRTSAAVFWGDWHNMQVDEVLVPGLLTTTNAGGAEIEGFELDASWAVASAYTFNVSAGWLDARYTQLGRTSTITLDSTFPLAPERSFSVGIAYERTLANAASIRVRADYGWLDRHVTIRDDALQSEQAPYGLLSARVTYLPSANWEVSLFGTNLTNEYYQLGGFLARFGGVNQGTVARPREIGLTTRYRF